MSSQAATCYRQVQIRTASPGQRVVMMYEAIARSLQAALLASEDPSPARFDAIHQQITTAQTTIEQLQMSLDKTNGGAIAQELDRLYDFWLHHLSEGNVRKSPANFREVRDMVMSLRDAWAQATSEARKIGID